MQGGRAVEREKEREREREGGGARERESQRERERESDGEGNVMFILLYTVCTQVKLAKYTTIDS